MNSIRLKYTTGLILLFLSCFTYAQEYIEVTGLSYDENRGNTDFARPSATNDTLELPFLDDFSTYTGIPSTTLWLNEGGVYVNNGFAFNPPTTNVATFDGIGSDGIPYVFPDKDEGGSTSLNGDADYLISKPINLDIPESDITLSFYWQKVGVNYSLAPELSEGDSLRLYFLDRDSVWQKVWPSDTNVINAMVDNEAGHDFEFATIEITDSAKYHYSGFQFKFTSNGRLNSNLDSWNIDYVYLDHSRSNDVIQDFAFGKQPTSILSNYRTMPVHQFLENITKELSDTVETTFTNLTTVTNFYQDSTATMYETAFSDPSSVKLDSTNVQTDNGGIISAGESITVTYALDKTAISSSILNIPNIGTAEELELTTTMRMVTPTDILKDNDVVSFSTNFANYFAYDDGSAELSVGFREFGQLAVAYELNTSDSLTAIDVYFPQTITDLEGEAITFKVWSSIEGVDGATSTEQLKSVSTGVYYSEESSAQNAFTRINLGDPILLNTGKFYIGYEQTSNEKILIGLDLSNDQSEQIYFRRGISTWGSALSESISGSIMMRPVFGENPISGVDYSYTHELNADLFPNPASRMLIFTGNVDAISIYDLTGNLKLATSFEDMLVPSLDVSVLDNGVYLVQIKNGELSTTRKLVVSK